MVYSTSKCPHCGTIIKKQTNPVHMIGSPFECCHWCGKVYLDSYKEEWITKSPIKRFFFFLQAGVWARAFMVPVLLLLIPVFAFGMNDDLVFVFWPILSLVWLIAGYFVHKNANKDEIASSLQRTKDIEYLNLLKNAGYMIYPIDEEWPSHHKKRSWLVIVSIVLFVILITVAIATPFIDDTNGLIEYESYYVGIRTITVEDKATAQFIVNEWENREATEDTMIALMDKYGTSQGGGQLYLVQPGDLIEEVNDWCFDRSRKVGDVAIIESDYGYTICYFSSVIEM